jgi:general secretion pathway protein G
LRALSRAFGDLNGAYRSAETGDLSCAGHQSVTNSSCAEGIMDNSDPTPNAPFVMIQIAPLYRPRGARPARSTRGFTLLELLVVMVIIGLLASYVGPKLFGQLAKSELKVARAQIEALGKALDQYRIDVGRYPSSSQGLTALVQRPEGEARWSGPYLAKAVPVDPWNRSYNYRAPGEHAEYDLFSNGPDGRSSGTEDAALRSW